MTTQASSIGLIVFDLGKVLLDFDFARAAHHLSPHSRLTPGQILDLLLRTPLLLQYERGELSTPQFFDAFVRQSGFRAPCEQFAAHFADIFTPIEPMLTLLDQLHTDGRPTAVLSNTNDLAIRHIKAGYPFFNRFQLQVLSYEHHAMKPDPALYRVLENRSGVPSSQILFLDDRPENVEAAQQLGWRAFVHRDPDTTLRAFTELGLLPRPVPRGP